MCVLFFFQAEDGIRYLVRSRGLGDVYKRQVYESGKEGRFYKLSCKFLQQGTESDFFRLLHDPNPVVRVMGCLLYTSDAADERSSVDLGGRRII